MPACYVCRTVKASIALAVLLLAGCSVGADERATVTGIVRIGPVPGPCVADQPCSRPAPGAELVFSGSADRVSVTSDTSGRYEVTLEPGRYRIRAAAHPPPASLHPASVVVEHDLELDLSIDSGAREPG
jgi:hypothetical protein